MERKEIEQIVKNIKDARNKINEIELGIQYDEKALKELIKERLKTREEILDKYKIYHGGYGQPCASSSNLSIKNIHIKEDLSITFDWYDFWAYGGEDAGSFSFSKEELLDGDFSSLEEKYSKKEKEKRINFEELERLEYERLKKKFENN